VNPNYKELNLAAQKRADRSHYHVYKQLVAARSHTTIQKGILRTRVIEDSVFSFLRCGHIGGQVGGGGGGTDGIKHVLFVEIMRDVTEICCGYLNMTNGRLL
jgi:hypothetical protein